MTKDSLVDAITQRKQSSASIGIYAVVSGGAEFSSSTGNVGVVYEGLAYEDTALPAAIAKLKALGL